MYGLLVSWCFQLVWNWSISKLNLEHFCLSTFLLRVYNFWIFAIFEFLILCFYFRFVFQFLHKISSLIDFSCELQCQKRVQNSVKYLRWNFMRKLFSTFSCYLFSQKLRLFPTVFRGSAIFWTRLYMWK